MFGLSSFINVKVFVSVLFIICYVDGIQIEDEYLEALRTGTVSTKTLSKATTLNNSESLKILEIICYEPPKSPDPCDLWRRTCLRVDSKASYRLHFGENASTVYQQYNRPKFSFHDFLFSRSKSYCVPPFRESCWTIGVNIPHTMTLDIQSFSLPMICCTIAGIIAFHCSRAISESHVFHYALGTISGTLFFTFIVGFFLTRLFTFKLPFVLLAMVGTGTLAYFTGWAYDKMDHLLEYYSEYVIAYVAITSVISFLICYIRGPITNPRSLEALRWILQGISLATIYMSISYETYGLFLCALIIISSFYK